MINNEILHQVRNIFNYSEAQMLSVFALAECPVSNEELSTYLLKTGNPLYVTMTDSILASFLNGVIIDKRGKKEGHQADVEIELNNNQIINKLKIALELQAEGLIDIFQSVDLTFSKHELSAFFRKSAHKHFKKCSDDTLTKFLNGLQNKYSIPDVTSEA